MSSNRYESRGGQREHLLRSPTCVGVLNELCIMLHITNFYGYTSYLFVLYILFKDIILFFIKIFCSI